MSKINLKQFVDIDIKAHATSVVEGTRPAVVIYTASGSSNTPVEVLSKAQAAEDFASDATTLAYLNMFFDNGGKEAIVIGNTPIVNLTNEVINDLDDKYICIAYAAADSDVETVYSALKTLAVARAADTSIYGINEKILLARSEVNSDTDKVKNFGVIYSDILGAEMTMAAYLSQINVYGINTVYDYAFTGELITKEDPTNAQFTTLINNNYNVDIELANEVRNCGGNMKDGSDLTNSYVRIVLHQTLTDRLINLLTQKLKNSEGISKIYASIAEELERYLDCGYLTTDKVWNDETLTVTRNGVVYTIIEKGTPLVSGYNITVLPMSALNTEEKAAHSVPPIYVIIADQYGIRKITIKGDII